MNKNPKRSAPCHPDKPHVAKDFCENCYRVYRRSLSSEDRKLSYDLRHRHKLPLDDYRKQEIKQNSKCAICKEPSSKNLCVDHDHTTQILRGLLCTKCNLMLGCAQDSILILESAIKYLETNTIDFREVE
jgi:hypothetical protein